MPLLPGKSHDVMAHNYEAEISAGKPPEQAKAIMLSKAYGPKKSRHDGHKDGHFESKHRRGNDE